MDDLGRIVIPKELRSSLGIDADTYLEILADENSIYLRKYVAGCTFCKGFEGLVEFCGTKVCKQCAKAILDIKN
jgi:transcriptional pleiotropic regulator of transition state genes